MPGAAFDPRDGSAAEPALELHRGPALGAPRQRHADPAALAEDVGERELRAVAEAVAVGEGDERQEHQPVAQLPERLQHRRPRHLHRMRTLVDQDDEHDVVEAFDRAVALADLDRLEPVGRLEALRRGGHRVRRPAARRGPGRRWRPRRRRAWCGCRARRRRPGVSAAGAAASGPAPPERVRPVAALGPAPPRSRARAAGARNHLTSP